ncbi:helix-turn-helix domain-containing protein [Paenibacillus flagellatus]|nr:helix-turn-helix domain-containing protein [Paenibacillus flagellatus]
MLNKMPIFMKYLISYIAVLIIPLLMIGLLVYEHYVDILKDEVTTNHLRMLDRIQTAFDQKVKEMNTIAAEIASKPELTPFQLQQTAYSGVKAKQLLTYSAANDFISDVLVYIRGQPYLYSGSSTYTPELFMNHIYKYESWSLEQFVSDMATLRSPRLRPSEPIVAAHLSDKRALTYMVPIPVNAAAPYGSVLFVIGESKVRTMLQGLLEYGEGNTMVFNEKGERIVSLRDGTDADELEATTIAQALSAGTSTRSYAGQDYVFSKVKSSYNGWTYVTMLPTERFLQRVIDVKNRAVVALCWVLAVGSALIYGLLHVNYGPVRRLLSSAGKQWGGSFRTFGDVTRAFHQIAEQNERLGRKVDQTRTAVREHMLLALMKGRVEDVDEFRRKSEEAGIRFTKPQLVVVRFAVRRAADGEPGVRAELAEAIERGMADIAESYRVDGLEGPQLNFLCAVDEAGDDWRMRIAELHGSVRETFRIDVAVGIGSPYRDLRELGKSFIEASTALDFKLIKGFNEVIDYRTMTGEQEMAVRYPRRQIETLEVLIVQGDTVSLNEAVRELLARIESGSMPLHLVRCVCYDMINCILKAMQRLDGGIESAAVPYPDVVALTKFDTVQELAALIERMGEQLCADIAASRDEAGQTALKRAMIEHIRTAYRDPQFSVQSMADHFSVSASYLKRFFKEQTGQTVTDYVNHCRLEQAKHLLLTTDLVLKDVVRDIGYFDVPSFIRKFKQTMKVTPGEYRKLRDDRPREPG